MVHTRAPTRVHTQCVSKSILGHRAVSAIHNRHSSVYMVVRARVSAIEKIQTFCGGHYMIRPSSRSPASAFYRDFTSLETAGERIYRQSWRLMRELDQDQRRVCISAVTGETTETR